MFLAVRAQGRLKETLEILKPLTVYPCPISKISYARVKLEKEDEGIILTSAYAVLAIPQTRLPLFCVGEHTAHEAKTLGHRVAFTGKQGAKELAEDIIRRYPAHNIVHVSGDQGDTEWYNILKSKGFGIKHMQSYTTEYVEDISEDILKKIKSNDIKVILFFSNKGVKQFLKLLQKYKIDPKNLYCIAFSQQIAQTCTVFKRVAICQAPEMQVMKQTMEAVKRHLEATA